MDQEHIRDANRKRILGILRRKGEVTRQDVSDELGLSIPTVSRNIDELVAEGFVEETGYAGSSGGRPAKVYRFLPASRLTIGVDVEPGLLRVAAVDLGLRVRKRLEIPLPPSDFPKFQGAVIEAVRRIRACLQEGDYTHQLPPHSILGVGVSLPGAVWGDVLEFAPNLGLEHVELTSLRSAFAPELIFENEANASALAEAAFLSQMPHLHADSDQTLVYISITEGLGTGMIMNGRLFRGMENRSGEFGHMVIHEGGRKCSCGSSGCWEAYASLSALLKEYRTASLSPAAVDLEFFCKQLKGDDDTALRVWRKYLDHLALGVQNIITAVDPSIIVFGGDLPAVCSRITDEVRKRIDATYHFTGNREINFVISRLGSDASLIGAALPFVGRVFLQANES